MGSLDFLANVMASHHFVATAEAVERAASLWRGHPPTDRSDITRAFAERPEMFTPDEKHPSRHGGVAVDGGFESAPDGSPHAYATAEGEPRVASPGNFTTPEPSPEVTPHPERSRTLQKVRDLIAVAVGHANDNEARANAVIACKLILEHDLLKPE